MTNREPLDIMRGAFDDILWMAIRYAHSRQTAAPGIVRNAVKKVRRVFPDYKVVKDSTLEPPDGEVFIKNDYLHDLSDEE